ncbi:hypothetical protein J6590_049766 [Homalodisca vitripennis]|nr:hypothetical protein J6590_049766 [Homalodisca vitripennis]
MCQALPLLPAHMAEAGYDHIVNLAHQVGVLQNLAVFLNYVHRVGVESSSVYKQRRRINNDMESYHMNLRDTMNTAHPNMPQLCKTTSSEKLVVQQEINTLTTRLDGGQYSIPEFDQQLVIKSLPRLPISRGSDDSICSLRTSRCMRVLSSTYGTVTPVMCIV